MLPQANWWRSAFSGSIPRATSGQAAFRAVSTQSDLSVSAVPATSTGEVQVLAEPAPSPSAPVLSRVMPLTDNTESRDHARNWMRWNSLTNLAGLIWLTGSFAAGVVWIWQRRRLCCADSIARTRPWSVFAARNGTFCPNRRRPRPNPGRRLSSIGAPRAPIGRGSRLAIPMPLVLGVLRPVIVIPAELLRAGAESRLRDVLNS